MVARATVRKIYNDPRLTVHVERCVLHWLMHWDQSGGERRLKPYIALRAANEARRFAAATDARRTEIVGRSNELMYLTCRPHVRTS